MYDGKYKNVSTEDIEEALMNFELLNLSSDIGYRELKIELKNRSYTQPVYEQPVYTQPKQDNLVGGVVAGGFVLILINLLLGGRK